MIEIKKADIPVGKWIKCPSCKEILYKEDVKNNLSICPKCQNYFRLSSRRRIEQVVDSGTFEEFELNIDTKNPLDMPEYVQKIEGLRQKTGLKEAVKCGIGKINNNEAIICAMDSNFFMGSMGYVVGEYITYSFEKAIEKNLPIVIFTVSGGARMQEGIISLMQMAKTSSVVNKLNDKGLLYISVLTDPTYGGVTASFATLADVIIAEPKAMVGFAGKRVIEQTINEKLPDEFQSSEFLFNHGFVDKIVERKDLKDTIAKIITMSKGAYNG
ncbi:MAG: acetyl-CoA carboxylase, carboxyltransferase subunit beta [Clostridia bacterium]